MKDLVYKDKQRFADKLMYSLLILGVIGSAYGAINFFIHAQRGNFLIKGIVCLILIGAFSVAIYYLRRLKMKVTVNDKGVKYKLSPFHREPHRIKWEEMESCEVIKTPHSTKWHGGNIHFTRESLYSLNGRNGLSIVTKDGSKYFIGVRDVDGLMDILQRKSF